MLAKNLDQLKRLNMNRSILSRIEYEVKHTYMELRIGSYVEQAASKLSN